MTAADVLLHSLEQTADNTRHMLERVPEDLPDWKPHAKSMPLGKLAMHCATLFLFGSYILEDDGMDLAAPRRPFTSMVFTSRDAALQQLGESFARCKKDLLASTSADLEQLWLFRYGNTEIMNKSRAATLQIMCLSHLAHHTAQLGLYLRLLDIPIPGSYGPSADEGM